MIDLRLDDVTAPLSASAHQLIDLEVLIDSTAALLLKVSVTVSSTFLIGLESLSD